MKMENFTPEQIAAVKNYLTAQVALDNHLTAAKTEYDSKLTEAVKLTVSELKKVFAQDEIDFITSAAYKNELINAFLK
jgi:hypothetical protein